MSARFRIVVKEEFIPAYLRAMTYKLRKIGSYRLTLSCGHVKRIKTSTKIPRRCRCSECPVDSSEVIVSHTKSVVE